MKKITFLFAVLALFFNSVSGQSVFTFETAVDNGDNVTETVDGVLLTVTGSPDLAIFDADLSGNYGGGTGYDIWTSSPSNSVTFTFDQPIDITSILAIEGDGSVATDYTFTPTGGGGSNAVVVATTPVFDGIVVDLNWVGVTSFTVTTSNGSGSYFMFDDLSFSPNSYVPPTPNIFAFETAVDNGDNITETVNGVLLTVTGSPDLAIFDADLSGNYGGGTGYDIWTSSPSNSVTFTFDQPIDINSILAIEGDGSVATDYTFTPTGGGGSNAVVVATTPVFDGIVVDLNWVGVTSFTVTTSNGSGSYFMFDDLSFSLNTLSTDDYVFEKTKVYPNPVENILHVKNISDLKSIKVYNNVGQLVLESKEAIIDVSLLSQGMYILQINTSLGTETKRIIKK
ncbi:T9SS type A sorting domain-containing protein [Mariniflexile sp. HMF6888]|uniref:T9SS type A sorting domain-containing protein n=1 Tax=Mariniflexile sp. HMF6888 TaxID=3373086 RepID=UPI00379172B0